MRLAHSIIPILLAVVCTGCVSPRIAGTAPPDAAGAELFVHRIFDRYRGHPVEGRRSPWAGPDWRDESVYSPEIVAMFARQVELAGDEVPEHGGGDEICQCQDWRDLRVLERTVRLTGEGRAEAFVRFENFGDSKQVRLLLAHGPAGWRVADLFYDLYPHGLVASLRSSLAQAERERRER